jgi:hypothetical protein
MTRRLLPRRTPTTSIARTNRVTAEPITAYTIVVELPPSPGSCSAEHKEREREGERGRERGREGERRREKEREGERGRGRGREEMSTRKLHGLSTHWRQLALHMILCPGGH